MGFNQNLCGIGEEIFLPVGTLGWWQISERTRDLFPLFIRVDDNSEGEGRALNFYSTFRFLRRAKATIEGEEEMEVMIYFKNLKNFVLYFLLIMN